MNFYDPVDYSLEENAFLMEALGEPPVVALARIPAKVNPNAVRPILERVYELEEMRNHRGVEWVGVDTLKVASKIYLEQYAKWQADKRRGAPRFPSMHSYDSKGRPHRQGPGSDGGKVQTYFAPDGTRKFFRVELVPSGVGEWVPEWASAAGAADSASTELDGLRKDDALHRYECLICNHAEVWKEGSRASENAARARMSKHLRKPSGDVAQDERHREVHTAVFGQRS